MNNNGIETERKFLIYRPDDSMISPDERWEIVQTYLKRYDPDVQRRVRKVTINSETKFYYTEKKRISDFSREENESVITEEEYEKKLSEADTELEPVIKTRLVLVYKGQRFEIDEYPFSDRLASIELELESEDQQIEFPPEIEIIKEVSKDPRYFNGALAKAKCFPEEY